MRLFRMHPEMLQANTKHGTNRYQKFISTLASLDGNNNVATDGRACIPNAQRWVFTIIFREYLSRSFGPIITQCS